MDKIIITARCSYELMATSERLDATIAIRNLLHCGNQEALNKLRELGKGGSIVLTDHVLPYRFNGASVLKITLERAERVKSERELRMEHLSMQLIKGAAGDAEAAIEYCRAELAGEISHAAYA